ncbi:MAG: segregation/condensation protein A [Hyphomicrobiaceae bacterium]|nr:segregation/condensation protein A [Hyphomicrobiaceae bacterium]
MSEAAWELPGPDDGPRPQEALVVDLDGFEGPLDLLLAMARLQKVDLSGISILALAEQYLAFIAEADRLRLEVAADYLVMAAWLAYLKSRLLLPREGRDEAEPSGEELAQRLAFRLTRLEAMREAAAKLMTRVRLGREVFARGMPEGMRTVRETAYTAQIYDLLKAYAEQRSRTVERVHVVKARTVWSIQDARRRLESLVGESAGSWVQLDLFLERYLQSPETGRTVLASSFGATLEMAKEGIVEIRQEAPFAPIYMRRPDGSSGWQRIG